MASPEIEASLRRLGPGPPTWTRPWLGVLVLLGTLLGSMTCMCGHFSLMNGFFLLATAAFGWCWCLHGILALRALVASLPVLCMGKVVMDVLWNGHDPILSRASSRAPEFLLVPPGLAVGGTVLLLYLGSLVVSRRARARAVSET